MRVHRVEIGGRGFDLPTDLKAIEAVARAGADCMKVTLDASRGIDCPLPIALAALRKGLELAGHKNVELDGTKPARLWALGVGYLAAMLQGAETDGDDEGKETDQT